MICLFMYIHMPQMDLSTISDIAPTSLDEVPDCNDFFNFNAEEQDFFENHVSQFLMELEVRLFILYCHTALMKSFCLLL